MSVNVYQHFRHDEHPFIREVQEWIERVDKQYTPFLTDFLDPRQCFILETLMNQQTDISCQFDGGYVDAERKRCLLYPEYYVPTIEDFELSLMEINYAHKFNQLTHSKILGALVHAGLKRDVFGDIISDGTRWQFFTHESSAQYIDLQIEKIGSVFVNLEIKSLKDLLTVKATWKSEQITVSSLRIDTIIAKGFNISRQQAKILVEKQKVKLNFCEINQINIQVAEQDLISVRQFGRLKINDILGTTKKEKIRLSIETLRKIK